jgi:hypothetical protein
MAMPASAPVLPNQKNTLLQNRSIHCRTQYVKHKLTTGFNLTRHVSHIRASSPNNAIVVPII